jgi:hypothetical protein
MFPLYAFKEQFAPEVNKETNFRRRTITGVGRDNALQSQ